MKKILLTLITVIVYSANLFAQNEGIYTPEWIAFKYFQDSLSHETNFDVKYYFSGQVSDNCSTLPYGFTELNYNFDTCLSQKCTKSNIEFKSNQRIRPKRLFKKNNLFINSACKIDTDLYLINIIYSNKSRGVIYHIFIKDKYFYKLKIVNYVH